MSKVSGKSLPLHGIKYNKLLTQLYLREINDRTDISNALAESSGQKKPQLSQFTFFGLALIRSIHRKKIRNSVQVSFSKNDHNRYLFNSHS